MHVHEVHGFTGIVIDALMITGFVFVIMLVVEYFNVLSSGAFEGSLKRYGWRQYLVGVLLGAVPGCLGGFAVASMYSHGVLSIGAVVATMIATTGDEAFVMLATFPGKALFLMCFLMVLGVAMGWLSDLLAGKYKTIGVICDQKFEVHDEASECFAHGNIINQWKKCSASRGILAVTLAIFVFGVVAGEWETDRWGWVRLTLMALGAIAFFIVSTVPDHFLQEHLWKHVARKHVPRIFAWTLGALLLIYFVTGPLESDQFLKGMAGEEAKWLALLLACLVGLIPESGPHLIFVLAYAHGSVPLGVLLASSIVQDGHAMLPILADSRRVFFGIKALKFVLGLAIGSIALLFNM
jgi:hypothetical protein